MIPIVRRFTAAPGQATFVEIDRFKVAVDVTILDIIGRTNGPADEVEWQVKANGTLIVPQNNVVTMPDGGFTTVESVSGGDTRAVFEAVNWDVRTDDTVSILYRNTATSGAPKVELLFRFVPRAARINPRAHPDYAYESVSPAAPGPRGGG